MRNKKEDLTPSQIIEGTTLEEVPCHGCGVNITIAVPFTGKRLCSGCAYGETVREQIERRSHVEHMD